MSQFRTPPSLKWLIDKRARLLGEISRYETARLQRIATARKEVENAENALVLAKHKLVYEELVTPKLLSSLRADLNSIDSVLSLHEIQIDPQVIPQIQSQREKHLLPYGEVTRLIYECLKLAENYPVSTTEIAMYVAAQNNFASIGEVFIALRKSVLHRLGDMCSQGKIKRLHPAKTVFEGQWKLK